MAVVRATSPFPFLLPFFLAVPWPETDPVFWQTLAVLVPFEIAALVLYMRALKVSPLSLSIPFLAFTPTFVLMTGWLVLGEQVTGAGMAGVLLTVMGAYVLYMDSWNMTFLAPFRAFAREEGARLMLGVAAIYSLTSVLGKKAVQHSSPLFFACFYFLLLAFVTPVVLWIFSLMLDRIRPGANFIGPVCPIRKGGSFAWTAWGTVGFFQAFMVICHMWAINIVAAAYMIAVKRTSLFFSVIFGKLVFDEEKVPQRLTGTGLMVTGVGLIVIYA